MKKLTLGVPIRLQAYYASLKLGLAKAWSYLTFKKESIVHV